MKSKKKTYSGKHTREKWHISYKFYIWNNKMMLVFGNLFILVSRSLFHPKDWTRRTETDIMFYLQRQRIDWKCERESGKKRHRVIERILHHIEAINWIPSKSLLIFPFPTISLTRTLSHSQWNVIFHRFNLQYWDRDWNETMYKWWIYVIKFLIGLRVFFPDFFFVWLAKIAHALNFIYWKTSSAFQYLPVLFFCSFESLFTVAVW